MPKIDDSRPQRNYPNPTEPEYFSPELQSEKMREIQEAAVKMTQELASYLKAAHNWSFDEIYDVLWELKTVKNYLTLAGDTLGRPFVKTAFSMAIRNYINSKE